MRPRQQLIGVKYCIDDDSGMLVFWAILNIVWDPWHCGLSNSKGVTSGRPISTHSVRSETDLQHELLTAGENI
jgi:hypothetical protein